MDSLSVTAASGMRARMQSLDMLANNLANASTGGFKMDHEFYSLYSSSDAANAAESGFAATPDSLPVVEKPWTDYSQGVLHVTDNPLDVALTGRGFLTVDGPSGVLYTRNGNLTLSPSGVLTTTDGFPLRTTTGKSIQSAPGGSLEILRDGTVRQDGQTLGQLQLSSFDEPKEISKQGMNYFHAIDSKKTVQSSTAEVHQGKLETSNVGSAESAVRLVSVMRQFEMLQKAMNLGAEMNKLAVEEVAKV